MFDLPSLKDLLRGLHTRELSLVEVETPRSSPFASSLLFDYVATYMYEGDTPNAERRAAALSLDRELLAELLGQEELRDLIDAEALDEVEADLQRLSERRRRSTPTGSHDILRAVGDLTLDEVQARCHRGASAKRIVDGLLAERRAVSMRIGSEDRFVASEDAGLFRDALGAVPPGGLPEVFLEPVEEPFQRLVRRYARTHGPFTTAALAARYGVDPGPVLRELERAGSLVRGELRPGGMEREWCDPDVLRRLRRASLATLRKEVEAVEQKQLARFLPAWQGVDASPAGRRGRRPAARGARAAPGRGAHARDVGARRAAAPARRAGRRPGSTSSARAARSCGSAPARSAAAQAAWRSTSARTCAGSGRRDQPRRRAGGPCPRRHPRAARGRRGVLVRPARRPRRDRDRRAAGGALGSGLGRRGHQRRLGAAARPAAQRRARPARSAAAASHAAAGPARRRCRAAGRSPRRCSPTSPPTARACARRPSCCSSATGSSRARRCSPRASRAGSRLCTASSTNLETLGTARRGYFVEGLGGAQFALAGAVERLRGPALRRARRRRSCSPRPTRPTPTARRCPGRAATRTSGAGPRASRARTWSCSTRSPRSTSSAAGRASCPLREPEESWLREALEALAEHVRRGRLKKLALERFDGEPIVGSPAEELLIELGFRQGPRKLTLSA